MRTSDFYQQQLDAIKAIAKSPDADWKVRVEGIVRRLQGETTPLARTTFHQLTADMSRDLDGLSRNQPQGTNEEVFAFASALIKKL
ncbi:MAG: hypothetical protein MUE49_12575 [Rhodospirillales bacterium]|jgi:hypothetical protein|nr:hypothetical protein [Rhodospirillales bacterium]